MKYLRSLRYWGLRYCCPVCGGGFRTLLPYGIRQRQLARCPRCGSLERHRLLWLFLRERTNFFRDPLKVLHLAPEECFAERFRRQGNLTYLSADLDPGRAMITMDLTDIPFFDDSFDCIIAVHVLEHIRDDRNALAEMHRVLTPGGWAIIQVPVRRVKTMRGSFHPGLLGALRTIQPSCARGLRSRRRAILSRRD